MNTGEINLKKFFIISYFISASVITAYLVVTKDVFCLLEASNCSTGLLAETKAFGKLGMLAGIFPALTVSLGLKIYRDKLEGSEE